MTQFKQLFKQSRDMLFEEVKKATTDEGRQSMRVIMIYELKDDSDKAIFEIIELTPPPSPPEWYSVLGKLSAEVPRFPITIGVMNKISYIKLSDVEHLPDNDEERMRLSAEGYMMLFVDTNSGQARSQLYDENMKEKEGAYKVFSIFDVSILRFYQPALALLSFLTEIMISLSTRKEDMDIESLVGIERHVDITTEREIEEITHEDIGDEEVNENGEKEDGKDSGEFSFNSN